MANLGSLCVLTKQGVDGTHEDVMLLRDARDKQRACVRSISHLKCLHSQTNEIIMNNALSGEFIC